MDEFELEMKQTFLEEAETLLDEAESAFMALDSGDRSPDLVDRIFRLAHNFKGSAKAVGFDGLSKFAHVFEDVLTKIKNKTIEPTPDICTLFLEALDVLKGYVAGLKIDHEYVHETQAMIDKLTVVRDQSGVLSPHVASSETAEAAHDLLGAPPQSEMSAEDLEIAAAMAEVDRKPTISEPVNLTQQKPAKLATTKTAPPQSEDENIRVSTLKLDSLLNLVGELVVNQSIMASHRSLGTTSSEHALVTLTYLDKLTHEIQDISTSLRMTPVKPLFQKMKRTLRDVARVQDKPIDFVTDGEHVELDKTVLDKISDPMTHLIRNAVDHGVENKEERLAKGKPELSKVSLKATQQEDHVLITISDDGKGLDRNKLIAKAIEKGLISPKAELSDQEAYGLIFKSGFSTKEQVTDISGRGVGMDVVQRAVDDLKGTILIETELGKGTSFIIQLPLSLSIITGMVVSIDQRKYVVPVTQLIETIEYQKLNIQSSTGKGKMINLRGEVIPVFSLNQILHGKKLKTQSEAKKDEITYRPGLVTAHSGRKVSFEIDEIIGQQQIVLKKLGHEMRSLPGVIAGAVLSNGEPGLVLSLHEFITNGSKGGTNAA